MTKREIQLNEEVTSFLEGLNHPLRGEIEQLRQIVLGANAALSENVKWNGPNFCFHGEDRLTMRIHPPKQIQLIFHRGAKVLDQPAEKLINDHIGVLAWKTNDRAVATFKGMEDIQAGKRVLITLINQWMEATTAGNNGALGGAEKG